MGESFGRRGQSALAFRLGEQLGDLFGVGIRELRRALGDEPVAPGVKLFALGENIGKPQLAPDRARHMRVQLAVLDEANHRGSAQAEDLRGLLGGNFLVAGQDADRLTVADCVGDPLEDLVELLGQFDTIMFASTGQEEGRLRRGPVTDLVRLDEAEDMGKPIGIARNRVNQIDHPALDWPPISPAISPSEQPQ